jgi:hypothetical protein
MPNFRGALNTISSRARLEWRTIRYDLLRPLWRNGAEYLEDIHRQLDADIRTLPQQAFLAGFDSPSNRLNLQLIAVHRQKYDSVEKGAWLIVVRWHVSGRNSMPPCFDAVIRVPEERAEREGLVVDEALLRRLAEDLDTSPRGRRLAPALLPAAMAIGYMARRLSPRTDEERKYGRHGALLRARLRDQIPKELRERFDRALAAKPI